MFQRSCSMKLLDEASGMIGGDGVGMIVLRFAGFPAKIDLAGAIAVPYAAEDCESGFRDGALMRPFTND